MRAVLGLAWYRFRASLGRRWTGYAAIIVLVGLVGGVSMASIAGARRTQASFPAYLASTNPSDLYLPTASWQAGQPDTAGADLSVSRMVARLPHVRGAANEFSLNAQPLGPNGLPRKPPALGRALGISILNNDGSTDGELASQDRLTPIAGRLADPGRENEIVVSSTVAQALQLHVGEKIPMGFYTNPQTNLPGYGTGAGSFTAQPSLRMDMTVVGIVAFNNQVVLDSLDVADTAQIVFTPALTRRVLSCCIASTVTFLRLDRGGAAIPVVEREIVRLAGPNFQPDFGLESSVDVAEPAIRPESIALAVFGGIAGLAALLVALQAIGRHLSIREEEARTLRALGADPAMTAADGLVGLVLAVVVGSVAAVALAVALSPLFPIGIVRPVYPAGGVAFDWPVLGFGMLILVVVLTALAGILAYRRAPHRVGRSRGLGAARPSSVMAVTGGSGLPLPAVEGARLALDPGAGRRAVPMRSAIVGTTLAIVVLIATVIFGTSLDTLVSHPPLYGWNWDFELTGGGGIAPVPAALAAHLLATDRSVATWSAVTFGGTAPIDGLEVPLLGQRPGAVVSPPVLTGRGLRSASQIVLGGATLAALHKRVGQTVSASIGGTTSRLLIVGTATMPTVGVQLGSAHPTMGTGALVSSALIPASLSNPNDVVPLGPNAIVVRLHAGVDRAVAQRSLERIADQLTLPSNYGVQVLAVQRPAEIINYRSMGTIPTFLGLGLAGGAVTALGFTLVASVRRRRRDLALLKTLGFTQRQLAATVAWQASVAVLVGTVVGVPLGIVAGRVLWDVFARDIDAVPHPSVPAVAVTLIAIGSLVLANLVAAIPGRLAARIPTALVLRSE